MNPVVWPFQCTEIIVPSASLPAATDRLHNRHSVWTASEADSAAIVAGVSDSYRELQKANLRQLLSDAQQLTSEAFLPDPGVPDPPLAMVVEGFESQIPVRQHSVIEMSHVGTVLTLFVDSPPRQLQWLAGAQFKVVHRP